MTSRRIQPITIGGVARGGAMARRTVSAATVAVFALVASFVFVQPADARPAPPTQSAQSVTAVVVSASAPIFVLPDASRVPLRTVKKGMYLKVLDVQDDWVQVEFDDTQFGKRVGFIEKRHVQLPKNSASEATVAPPTPQASKPAEQTTDASKRPAESQATQPKPAPAPPAAARPMPATATKATTGGQAVAASPQASTAGKPQAPTSPKQTAKAPNPRKPTVIRTGTFVVNAGYQAAKNDFTETWRFTANRESGSAQAVYPVQASTQFDIGGGVRIWRDLLVGVAVSRYNRGAAAHASADVPHPFYYSQMRHVAGDSASLTREELAVHIQPTWMFAPARRVQVGIYAGPTWMRVSQPFVTNVNYTDSYPYDSATFSSATTQKQSASKVTLNAGTDVTYLLMRQVGVGFALRFSNATLSFKAPDGTSVSLKAGGLQAGLGLRFRF